MIIQRTLFGMPLLITIAEILLFQMPLWCSDKSNIFLRFQGTTGYGQFACNKEAVEQCTTLKNMTKDSVQQGDNSVLNVDAEDFVNATWCVKNLCTLAQSGKKEVA